MQISEVVRRFANRIVNKRQGSVTWANGSGSRKRLYCEGDVLYSYGDHFPLAKYLGEDESGEHMFVLNGDHYSASTSGHQGQAKGQCKGPWISETALRATGGIPDLTGLKLGHVVDWANGTPVHVHRHDPDGPWILDGWDSRTPGPFRVPKQGGHLVERKAPWMRTEEGECFHCEERPPVRGGEWNNVGTWYPIGGALLRSPTSPLRRARNSAGDSRSVPRASLLGEVVQGGAKQATYFLCGIDAMGGYVARLSGAPKSLAAAHESLIPKEVKAAREEGLEVKQLGRWFFVPTGIVGLAGIRQRFGLRSTIKEIKESVKQVSLPKESVDPSGPDVRAKSTTVVGTTFAYGTVMPGSDCYRQLRLGDEWHQVFSTTELKRARERRDPNRFMETSEGYG